MKNKILETARKLFNSNGLRPVTARMICNELSISPGSFSYHYPNKDLILETLSSELLVEYDTIFSKLGSEDITIADFLKTLEQLFNLQHRYRFFYLNLFEVLSQHQATWDIYSIHFKKNSDTFQRMLTRIHQTGRIRKDISSKELYSLSQVYQILINQWLTNTEINEIDSKKEKIKHHLKTCASVLYPNLTKKGTKEYKNYFK